MVLYKVTLNRHKREISLRCTAVLDCGPFARAIHATARVHQPPRLLRKRLGSLRSAKQLGDIAASRDAYQKLVALSTSAVSERPELSEAKAFLTN